MLLSTTVSVRKIEHLLAEMVEFNFYAFKTTPYCYADTTYSYQNGLSNKFIVAIEIGALLMISAARKTRKKREMLEKSLVVELKKKFKNAFASKLPHKKIRVQVYSR